MTRNLSDIATVSSAMARGAGLALLLATACDGGRTELGTLGVSSGNAGSNLPAESGGGGGTGGRGSLGPSAGGTSAGGFGGFIGSGGSTGIGFGTGGFVDGFGGGGPSLPPNDSGTLCESIQLPAPPPLNVGLLFLIDRSAGMGCAVGDSGPPPYSAIAQAIEQVAPAIAGNLVFGVEFFGRDAGDAGASCNSSDYVQPDIDVGPPAANAAAIGRAFDANAPSGEAPLAPAVEGALLHLETLAEMEPSPPALVVVTGMQPPSGCGASSDVLAAVATGVALRVDTYVIGIPTPSTACDPATISTNRSAFDAIAQAGGTASATIMSPGDPDIGDFFYNALTTNIGNAFVSQGCSYAVPLLQGTPDGKPQFQLEYVDQNRVTQKIPQVAKGSCAGPDIPGWFFEDPASLDSIQLCLASCVDVQRTNTTPVLEIPCVDQLLPP